MSEYGTDCTSPVGRIVWGSPTKMRQKTHRTGPQKGQPQLDSKGAVIQEISFGVAYQKADFLEKIWPFMSAEIATGYPNGVPGRFAYKYVDADTVDDKGVPYANREGYAGCYVLVYTQRINETFGLPPIFKFNQQAGRYDQLDVNAIKCGDYVAIGTNFKVHVATGSDDTPSIYVNPRAIELVQSGVAISTGAVDAASMFGGQVRQLPAGAAVAPMTASPVGMPGAAAMPPMAPAAAAMPPMAPAASAMPPMAPAASAPAVIIPPAIMRPIDPTHIHAAGTAGEQWWVNGVWMPAVVSAPLPPPAPDFVTNAGMQGMPPPR
jgi:hypothetical protein